MKDDQMQSNNRCGVGGGGGGLCVVVCTAVSHSRVIADRKRLLSVLVMSGHHHRAELICREMLMLQKGNNDLINQPTGYMTGKCSNMYANEWLMCVLCTVLLKYKLRFNDESVCFGFVFAVSRLGTWKHLVPTTPVRLDTEIICSVTRLTAKSLGKREGKRQKAPCHACHR